jgi:Ser/Thr protein kinase RdoA (MazF antagonist)
MVTEQSEHLVAEGIAHDALAHYGIDPASSLDFIKYRENHVYRVTTPTGESYALRIHRPNYRSDREIVSELNYLRELGDRGFRVPSIVPSLDGSLLTVLGSGDDAPRVSVQHWLHDTQPMGDVTLAFDGSEQHASSAFQQLGRIAAEMHVNAEQLGHPDWFERSPWDLDGLVGEKPLWGDPTALSTLTDAERDTLTATIAKVRAALSVLPVDAHHFGIVHADLTPENILLHASGPIVIDFDDFGEGWYLFDLATVLFFFTHQESYEQHRAALFEGYLSVRELSALELSAWDAMLLARAFTYLGWASDREGDEAAAFISSELVPWVITCCTAYLADTALPWGVPSASKELS